MSVKSVSLSFSGSDRPDVTDIAASESAVVPDTVVGTAEVEAVHSLSLSIQ